MRNGRKFRTRRTPPEDLNDPSLVWRDGHWPWVGQWATRRPDDVQIAHRWCVAWWPAEGAEGAEGVSPHLLQQLLDSRVASRCTYGLDPTLSVFFGARKIWTLNQRKVDNGRIPGDLEIETVRCNYDGAHAHAHAHGLPIRRTGNWSRAIKLTRSSASASVLQCAGFFPHARNMFTVQAVAGIGRTEF